jgi:hypothetical protein
MKIISKIITIGLFAAAIAIAPTLSHAADTNSPAAAHARLIPFHGKVAAVDTAAMTLTIGKRTFKITDDTRILKDGAAAKLSDVAVDQSVSGSYKKSEDGTLTAQSLNLTPSSKKKKKKDAAE